MIPTYERKASQGKVAAAAEVRPGLDSLEVASLLGALRSDDFDIFRLGALSPAPLLVVAHEAMLQHAPVGSFVFQLQSDNQIHMKNVNAFNQIHMENVHAFKRFTNQIMLFLHSMFK